MKKILIIALLAFGTSAYAQQSNEEAVAQMESQGYFGNFAYQLDDIHTINVNYSFTPRVPTNNVEFSLHTPEPRPLSLRIINNSGEVVKEWLPKEQVYLKKGSINIANLPKGNYTYQILWDNKLAKEIPFKK